MYCGDKTAEEGSVVGYLYSALSKQLRREDLGRYTRVDLVPPYSYLQLVAFRKEIPE